MERIARILTRLSRSASLLAGLAVMLMILHISIDVIMRFAFDMPISGTILMVSLMYMPMIAFLPLAVAEERDAHISVELLYDMFPQAFQRCLDFAAHLLSILVYALLAVRTWSEALSKYAIGAAEMEGAVRIPTWPSYFVLPVGFALIIGILAYRVICLLARRKPDFGPGDAEAEVIEETHSV